MVRNVPFPKVPQLLSGLVRFRARISDSRATPWVSPSPASLHTATAPTVAVSTVLWAGSSLRASRWRWAVLVRPAQAGAEAGGPVRKEQSPPCEVRLPEQGWAAVCALTGARGKLGISGQRCLQPQQCTGLGALRSLRYLSIWPRGVIRGRERAGRLPTPCQSSPWSPG